jgi:cyclophilin family peptidyl-prolyl cis-trans isomerase
MYNRLGRSPLRAAVHSVLELLESRRLFHNAVLAEIPDQAFQFGDAGIDIDLTSYFDNEDISGSVVEINTSEGAAQIELFDDATPVTVQNFLNYVTSGRYNNTLIHRAMSNFVVQAGGYGADSGTLAAASYTIDGSPAGLGTYTLPRYSHITQDAQIVNEFATSPRDANGKVNTRGTLAMAKLGSGPNTATSEWFVNLGDNSANLDAQNGGFTTFARVLGNGMDVFDSLLGTGFSQPFAAFDETDQGYTYSNLPTKNGYSFSVQNSAATLPATNQLAIINSVSMILENTFTISSSNTAVINPSVTGSTLSLNPAAGGTATITVTATSLDGHSISDRFDVTVAAGDATITVGPGASRSLVFVDADGTKTTITSKDATASIHIIGTDVGTSTSNSGVTTVTGTGLAIENIDLTAMSSSSKLTVTASRGGDGAVTLPDITADGTLDTLDASRGVLTGALSTAGSLRLVKLGSIVGGSISSIGADEELSLTVGSVSDSEINVAGIKKITSGTWTDTDATPDTIVAFNLDGLTVKGDFAPDVTLTGEAGKASISGTLTGGTWNVAGAMNKLAARDIAVGWTGVFGAQVGTVDVGDVFDGVLAVASVKKIEAKTFSASLTASATDGDAIGTITTSAMTDAEIRSAGNVKSITVSRGISRSGIYLGVGDGVTSIDDVSDFTNADARLAKATFKAPRGAAAFSETAVVAAVFGKVSLGTAADVASSVPFYGVGAGFVEDLACTLDGQKARIRNADDQAAADAQLVEQEVGRTNFNVIVV